MIITKNIGYYQPSNANWSYCIHMVTTTAPIRQQFFWDTLGGNVVTNNKLKDFAKKHHLEYYEYCSLYQSKFQKKDIKAMLTVDELIERLERNANE